jgi:hypothetical protein
MRNLMAVGFAEAFGRWYQRREKCVAIDGNYVEKT